MFNSELLKKSIFPVIIEDGCGVPKLQTGTGFILEENGYYYVLTAWHCISSVIRQACSLSSDFYITGNNIRNTIKKYIFFGVIQTDSAKEIFRIPIDYAYNAIEEIGNRADLIVCSVDMESFKSEENKKTSLNELIPLKLSPKKIQINSQYHVCGFPQRLTQITNNHIKASFEHRYLKLNNILPPQNNPLVLETGILDFSLNTNDSFDTLEGFSGAPIIDEDNNVVGLAYEITNNKKMHFITNDAISFMLHNCL